jgi:hypothetical protein
MNGGTPKESFVGRKKGFEMSKNLITNSKSDPDTLRTKSKRLPGM